MSCVRLVCRRLTHALHTMQCCIVVRTMKLGRYWKLWTHARSQHSFLVYSFQLQQVPPGRTCRRQCMAWPANASTKLDCKTSESGCQIAAIITSMRSSQIDQNEGVEQMKSKGTMFSNYTEENVTCTGDNPLGKDETIHDFGCIHESIRQNINFTDCIFIDRPILLTLPESRDCWLAWSTCVCMHLLLRLHLHLTPDHVEY